MPWADRITARSMTCCNSRTLPGQFKAPETLRERAREGAFFVAEEFAF